MGKSIATAILGILLAGVVGANELYVPWYQGYTYEWRINDGDIVTGSLPVSYSNCLEKDVVTILYTDKIEYRLRNGAFISPWVSSTNPVAVKICNNISKPNAPTIACREVRIDG